MQGNNNSEPIGRSYTTSYGYKVHDFENIVRFSFFSFDFGIESYFGYVLCKLIKIFFLYSAYNTSNLKRSK